MFMPTDGIDASEQGENWIRVAHIIWKRDKKGVYIKGAKAHQTGTVNSHWLIVMPTMRLKREDEAFAIIGAIPADAEGITYVCGR